MRQIKFRSWDKHKNKMVDNVVGFGFYSDRKELLKQFDYMQFTNIKDVNKKEIYLGDIVEIPIQNEFGSVSWEKGKIGYVGSGFVAIDLKTGTRTIEVDSRMKVVGNLYENPELLK